MSKNRPSPITAFDEYTLMAPIVDLQGDKSCVAFYTRLFAELKQREKIGGTTA